MESFIWERKLQAANALSAAINAQRKITIASALYLPTTISSFLHCTLALRAREVFLLLLIFYGLQRDSCSFIAIWYLSAAPELFTNPFSRHDVNHWVQLWKLSGSTKCRAGNLMFSPLIRNCGSGTCWVREQPLNCERNLGEKWKIMAQERERRV